MQELRVTLVQPSLFWHDAAANRRHFGKLIADLTAATDIVILPEMFASGFSMEPGRCAESMDGATVEWMRRIAVERDVAVCGSLAIREAQDYFNRFVFVAPDGACHCYDKHHLYTLTGENRVYRRGTTRVVFTFRGWRIRPQICYDLRFPEWSRSRGDTDLLIFVASWPHQRRNHWRGLLQARAIENQCYVIGVNRVGDDGNDLHYVGDSGVYEYSGERILELGAEPRVATVSLDLRAQTAYRERLPFLQDADGLSNVDNPPPEERA